VPTPLSLQGICYSDTCPNILVVKNGQVSFVPKQKYFEGLMGLSYDARWEPLGWLAFITFCYVIFILLSARFISHQKK
jgi:hypothetical protein